MRQEGRDREEAKKKREADARKGMFGLLSSIMMNGDMCWLQMGPEVAGKKADQHVFIS